MKLKLNDIPSIIRNLTKEQRKIIYIALIVSIFFLLLIILVYLPQAKRLSSLKKKIAETETQIDQIMSVAKGRDLATVAKELRENLTKTVSKFPKGEDIVVAKLTDAAEDQVKLIVQDVTPGARQAIPEKVLGLNIDELTLTMSFSGEYRAIGEFLDILRGDFPVYIRVRSIEITGKGEGKTLLDCTLQLSAYLRRNN